MGSQSKQFRRVFANAFSIQFGDNDACVTLGYHVPPSAVEDMIEEVAVVMTPRTTKILAYNLMAIVSQWEKQFGEITVPAEKFEVVTQSIIDQIAAMKSSKPMGQ